MPTEFVRVRDPETKTESSLPRRRAEQLAGRGAVEILDGTAAVNGLGDPLPPSTAETASAEAPSAGRAVKSKEQTR
ncbi:hypothetical protein ABZY58_25990 [Micromonospora tulbaghiae]|uniref:hypothetical protein n=1 Tax=Micromonospora tulbaghiae TaxID=479978 RepID=UPI0033A5C3DD